MSFPNSGAEEAFKKENLNPYTKPNPDGTYNVTAFGKSVIYDPKDGSLKNSWTDDNGKNAILDSTGNAIGAPKPATVSPEPKEEKPEDFQVSKTIDTTSAPNMDELTRLADEAKKSGLTKTVSSGEVLLNGNTPEEEKAKKADARKEDAPKADAPKLDATKPQPSVTLTGLEPTRIIGEEQYYKYNPELDKKEGGVIFGKTGDSQLERGK